MLLTGNRRWFEDSVRAVLCWPAHRLMPPYCITAEQLARVYGAIAEVLDALAIR
jgi:adenosylmethionine-8-amino-7-oxononanoate aminotransferase